MHRELVGVEHEVQLERCIFRLRIVGMELVHVFPDIVRHMAQTNRHGLAVIEDKEDLLKRDDLRCLVCLLIRVGQGCAFLASHNRIYAERALTRPFMD